MPDPRAAEAVPPLAPERVPAALGLHLSYGHARGEQCGAELDHPLFQLLAAVADGGSIRHAACALGISYRHAWGALRKWERLLGEPLVNWAQGRKARLTDFATRLQFAERRARTRLQPQIEALRADLGQVLARARDPRLQLLTMRASHDLALPVLQRHVAEHADLHLELGFQGSVDALRALNDGRCLVAGFHVPALRGAAPVFSRALKPLLKPATHRLIACAQRTQGLILRREHAALVRTFPDIARLGLRFASRQPGSGTRMLIEHLLSEHSVAPLECFGPTEHVEHTHVAVALCIASGVADAGVGVEAAALQFGLHFVPLVEESYYLACLSGALEHAGVRRLRQVLGGARWIEILASLPGYSPASDPGSVLEVDVALPWWPHRQRRGAAAARRTRARR